MRKQIPISQLRVGMAVEEVHGPWLAHGLWKTRFVIQDAAELVAIQASNVAEVVIDTDLGLDVSPTPGMALKLRGQPPVDSLAAQASRQEGTFPPCRSRSPGESWAQAQALVADTFRRMRASQSIDQAAVTNAVKDIMCTLERDPFAMMGLGLLKECDTFTFTYSHSVSVCALMVAFGQHLRFDAEHCRALGTAGLFHDIGKAAVSEALLLKRGPLTNDELIQVKQHPALGGTYLKQVCGSCPIVVDVCLHHHERIDGTGYLCGLKGHQISQESRMAAICDVYDAITSARPYKEAWDPAVALRRMALWTGHFDRRLLASFVSMLSPYPVGTLVRLASGRVAVVIRPSPETPRKAVVQVFYDARTHAHLVPRQIDLAKCDDEIKALESEGAWSTEVIKAVRWAAFSSPEI